MLSIHSQHPQEIFIYEYPFERLYSGTYRRISDTGESFRRLYFVKRVIFVVLMTHTATFFTFTTNNFILLKAFKFITYNWMSPTI
ncbi:Hypothetical predicted protein [Octopus vulgaris]|uniref:Uncharacterized protein n=1 Tax=Octopus vulgaris TaxID=6645 RepID=A0AA36B1C0_OCTVU|nr:Hypothetical predicted protein [Octopus vulgaris]